MNTQTTPPVLKTLFPLEGNRHLVDKLASEGKMIFVMCGNILFEGDVLSTNEIKTILRGGVTA